MPTKRKSKVKRAAPKPHAPKPVVAKTKQQQLIEMLQRPGGATIEQMAESLGWQAHTVRGALSGALKKRLGLLVTSTKEESGRVYRLAAGPGGKPA